MKLVLLIVSSVNLCTLVAESTAKNTREKYFIRVIQTLMNASLAVLWPLAYASSDSSALKAEAICFCIMHGFVFIIKLLDIIAMTVEMPKNKTIGKAEKLINQLKTQHNGDFQTGSYVGQVIERLETLFKECKNIADPVESVKQVFSYFLPEYLRIYTKYLETIKQTENYETIEKYVQQMAECSKKFKGYIEHAGEDQKRLADNLNEMIVLEKGTDFQTNAEMFNTMIEIDENTTFQQ